MMSKENKKVRVLAIFKAPAPYIDPLLQLWATPPQVDRVVAYSATPTHGEPHHDPRPAKTVAPRTQQPGGVQIFVP